MATYWKDGKLVMEFLGDVGKTEDSKFYLKNGVSMMAKRGYVKTIVKSAYNPYRSKLKVEHLLVKINTCGIINLIKNI